MTHILDSLDPEKLTEQAKVHVAGLSRSVYGKKPSELEKNELLDLISLDVASFPAEFSISAGATRRTDVQYCSNNYHLSEKLDVSGMATYIREVVSNCDDATEMVNTYVSLRSAAMRLCQVKVDNTEEMLREMIADMERKDGQNPQGRHG